MEITTCEQYVLAELEIAKCENEALRDEVKELLDKLAEAGREPEHVAQRVAEIGRRLVFEEWFYTSTSSSAESFEEFCNDKIAYGRPDDVSKCAAIRFFTPELRELWEYTLVKREAEAEDKEGN